MVLNKITDMYEYARFIVRNPEEIKALCSDILIHVTRFFRDPEAYAELIKQVLPALVSGRAPGSAIRIWVPGCSTGPEVYSIAIALLEFLGERASQTPIQIFGSDISEQSIQKARTGEYPESIASELTPERLNRYFSRLENGQYRIAKSIRDICLFSRHDLTAAPPFAKIDLISCRNVLIYFSATLQKHVVPVFQYSLVPDGFLFLGASETIGNFSELFSLVNKTAKIYARKNAPIGIPLRFPATSFEHRNSKVGERNSGFSKLNPDMQRYAEQALHTQYPGVLVNEQMEILQLRGRTSPYIEPAPGAPSHNLLKMAYPNLLHDLRKTIQLAQKSGVPTRRKGLSLELGKVRKSFNLNVIPVALPPPSKEVLFLILFEKCGDHETHAPEPPRRNPKSKRREGKANPRDLASLRQELVEAHDYQHSLIERFEIAQQDLTIVNEELQSANEEFQSTNEELETAKEELQSGNEELTTVNDELQIRSHDQTETNNDLINLLGSVKIPIVMLGNDRRVRRFTPLAGKALNLIATDIGRPFSDLKLNFSTPGAPLNLNQLVTETIETMSSHDVEVQDEDGKWFRLQIKP